MTDWNTAVRTIVACAILIVLHYTLRPLLAWRASIDFLIIALLIGSVRLRPGAAAMYGFFLGFVADSVDVSGFGAAALAMSIVGFSASWLKAVFFADNLALNGFFLFLAKWVFDVIVPDPRAPRPRCRADGADVRVVPDRRRGHGRRRRRSC